MNCRTTLPQTPNWFKTNILTTLLVCIIAVFGFSFDARAVNIKSFKTNKAKVDPPVVNSFAPSHGPVGTILTVNGTNLAGVSLLKIGNKTALILSKSSTTITAMVMPGTVDGNISAYIDETGATTTNAFLVTIAQPPVNVQANKVGYLEGLSIALSADGNTMAVKGAERTFTGGVADHPPHPSDATVYRRNNGVWTAYAEVTGSMFQLSADGKTLMNDTGIYTDNGSGAFILQYTFPPTSGFVYPYGRSLSADGKLALVTSSSAVYSHKNIDGNWRQPYPSISEFPYGTFGAAVSLSADGKTALVAQSLRQLHETSTPGFYTDSLGAWVYTLIGTQWIKQAQLATYGSSTDSISPLNNTQAISADGNRIIINKIVGKAMIFDRTGNTWTRTADFPYATGTGTVSMSADGKTVMFAKYGSGTDSKTFGIDIYKENGNTWTKVFSDLRAPVSNDGTTSGTAEFTAAALSADGSTAVTGTLGYWNSGVIVYSNVLPPPPDLAVPWLSYAVTGKTFNTGQAVNLIPNSSNVRPYGYDAVNYPNSTNYKTGFEYPNDIAIDKEGINLYVVDRYGKRIIVVPAAYSGSIEGHITKVYNLDANPFAIAVDQQNNIYYSDSSGHDIKKCLPSGGCSIYASGAVTFAFSIAVDKAGNLYVVDSQESKVKKIPAGGGTPVDFGGTWGTPNRVRVDSKGNVYVTDGTLKVIRKIPADGSAPVNIDISDGYPTNAQYGLTIDNSGNLFTSRFTPTPVQVRETFEDGSGSVVIPFVPCCDVRGYGDQGNTPNLPKGIVVDALGRLHMADGIPNKRVQTVAPVGGYFIHPALPDGLSLDRNTGVISGTPTSFSALTTYTITGWNPNGYASTAINLGVVGNITSFSPATTQPGSIVTITGTQLDNPTSVKIGDTTAIILTATANSITAMVMPGAVTGKVSVTNAGGTVSSSDNITIINTPAPVNRQIPNLGDFSGQFMAINATGTVGIVANDGKGKAVYKNAGSGWVLQTVLSETTGAVSINANGTVIATTNSIYDGASGSWVKLIDSPVGPLLSVAISADGNTVIGAAADKKIYTLQRVGNTYTLGAPAFTLANTKSFGHKLALSGDGKTIAISGFSSNSADTASIWIYGLSGGAWQKQRLLRANPRNSTYIPPVAISANGNKVMIGYNPEDPGSYGYSIIYTRRGQTWAESEAYPEGEMLKTSNGFDIDVHNYISMSADGKTAMIGGKREPDGTFGFWIWRDQRPRVNPVKYKITLQPGKDSIGTDSVKNVATVALSANGSAAFVGVPGALQAGVAVYSNLTGTLPGTPTLQATNVVVSDITPADATINWTKGNGENRVVFVRVNNRFEGDMPEFPAPSDGTYYPANAKFGLGGKVADWYCVYNGSGSTTKVTGLLQTTQYRVAVIEYNRGPGDEKYLVNYLAPVNPMKPVNFSTPRSTTTPTLPASGIVFKNTTDTSTNVNWVNGDGQSMAVFMAKTNTGFAVPVDNVTYTANALFGKGTQIGNTGWYCVMLGSGNNNFAEIRGLMANTTYRVAVIPFNNGPGKEKYLTANQTPANVVTKPSPIAPIAPTVSSKNLTFTNTTTNSTNVHWISGNGSYRAVFMAKTANGVAAPIDSTFYYDNPIFGAGTQIGTTGWYCVYTGTGASAAISGLMSNTTYRVTVVEYNGGTGDVKYLRNNLAPASVVTAISPNDPPTVPSLQLTFNNITTTSTTVNWTSGNGAMRAVFVAKTANGVAAPVNNSIYTANSAFSTGSQIGGTGWYCVYNGTGNSTTISGLNPLTTYRVTVVDYNNTSAPKYMNTKLAPASVLTLASPSVAPTIPSLKLTFTNITTTGTTVNWISGNGSRRAVFIARRADGVAAPIDNTTYSANANFAAGTQIGATGWYCVYDGTGSSANINGLTPGTTYRLTVVDYNGTAGTQKYMNSKLAPAIVTTAATSPTIPSLKLTFTNITSTATNVSWISGNGAMRAVFVARTANGVANALNNTTYTANQNFGAGTQIGSTGWYCVYNGNGNNTNITGLVANTTYRVTVIEYNGSAGAQLYTNDKLSPAIVTTIPAGPVPPTAPSLYLNFSNTTNTATTVSWNSGNGYRRAVFVARRSDGVAAPTDNTTYTGNPTFAGGTQIGTTGWYCVYDGTGSSADITGLTAGTVYRVTVVDYNGTPGNEKYMNTRLAPASVITASGTGLHSTFASLKTDVLATDETAVREIEASNLLSPNGDGKNDTWVVKNIEQYKNNTVTVFDQSNNILYTKSGYANDWAGTYRGGVVKEGTYYYLIDLGNGITKKGFITVLSSRQ